MVEWWGKHDGVGFPHVVLAQQFEREHLEKLFKLTLIMKKTIKEKKKVNLLNGNIIASLFYEPSTRTRFSFETAAIRLGADRISSENAAQFSSAIKGETLKDTIRIISDKADVIVIRHKQTGSAAEATAVTGCVPIINGGDGTGQHPTQSLLDVFTIQEHFGSIDSLKVAMVGDLKRGRTVHSLAYLLSKFPGVEIIFVAPPCAQMKQEIKDHLDENKVKWSEGNNLLEVAKTADVIYMTRYQLERAESNEEKVELESAGKAHIMNRVIANLMPEKSIILHPLPRVEEIRWSVDSNPRARYFEQAANGDYVRMALLLAILNPAKAKELLAQAG